MSYTDRFTEYAAIRGGTARRRLGDGVRSIIHQEAPLLVQHSFWKYQAEERMSGLVRFTSPSFLSRASRVTAGASCIFRDMGTKATAKACVKPGATLLVDGSLIRVDRITQGGKARAGDAFHHQVVYFNIDSWLCHQNLIPQAGLSKLE